MRVVVTGSSGKAGRVVLADLLDHGYTASGVDLAPPPAGVRGLQADLTDLGQVFEALRGAEAVVHLANIPAPGLRPPAATLVENVAMNHHVFAAAVQLGLRRVVWASSETTLGLPFDTPPRYAPVDEAHYPFPETTYALSKVLSEDLAIHHSRWSSRPFIGLRFSNIMEPGDYARFASFQADPRARKWNLWGYVDVRDVAQACRLALEADVAGAQAFIIAAADTVMERSSRELMAEVFPGVEVRGDLGEHQTLLAIDKARALLGFAPTFSWRSQ
jgi:nucleoside-diphosphate-sugar epimerase